MFVSPNLTALTNLATSFEQAKRSVLHPGNSKGLGVALPNIPQAKPSVDMASVESRSQSSGFNRAAMDQSARDGILLAIQGLQKRAIDAAETARLSREKGEAWVYDSAYSNNDDPSSKSYRLLNQPEDFEFYLAHTQAIADAMPALVKQLWDDYDQVGQQSPAGTESVNVVT